MNLLPNNYVPAANGGTCEDSPASTVCRMCGDQLTCGVRNDSQGCWCQGFPPLPGADPGNVASCLCPSCLGIRLQAFVDKAVIEGATDSLLSLAHSVSASPEEEFIDYVIEDGNYVFTGWYHLKRGYCCGSGCRNCPFD